MFAGASSINSSSSTKAFLFSLRSFYGNLSTTRLDIKPLRRHLAVTLDSYNKLSFGINDLTVNLDNRNIVGDVGNVYQAPSVSEPDKFFPGETHFQADGLEVLVLEGELLLALSSCYLNKYIRSSKKQFMKMFEIPLLHSPEQTVSLNTESDDTSPVRGN